MRAPSFAAPAAKLRSPFPLLRRPPPQTYCVTQRHTTPQEKAPNQLEYSPPVARHFIFFSTSGQNRRSRRRFAHEGPPADSLLLEHPLGSLNLSPSSVEALPHLSSASTTSPPRCHRLPLPARFGSFPPPLPVPVSSPGPPRACARLSFSPPTPVHHCAFPPPRPAAAPRREPLFVRGCSRHQEP